MADNAQMIIELDRKRMTAMAEKDIATLNAPNRTVVELPECETAKVAPFPG